MSQLHEMKIGAIPPHLPGSDYRYHQRRKIVYRDTEQKCPEKRTERIAFLKSLRSKTKRKTAKAVIRR